MSKPSRPAKKTSPSKGPKRPEGPQKTGDFKKPSSGKPEGKKPGGFKKSTSGKPEGKKPGGFKKSTFGKPEGKKAFDKPSKPVNPFGEKKRTAGGKKPFGKGGKKDFRKREDDNLVIILSDRDAATVANIKLKLQEIREYKKILSEDGQKPDAEDKARESELIIRLLRMEKQAKMEARQRAKAAKTEAYRVAEEKEAFAKEKKKGRAGRFSDDDDQDSYRDSGDDDYSPRKKYDDDY